MPKAGSRKGKRTGRRTRGLELKERDGFYHVHGTVRVGQRSVRVRRSLGLPADAESEEAAWTEIDKIRADILAEAQGKPTRGDPVSIAARAYLTSPRERPLAPSAIRIVQEIVKRFGTKFLNDIGDKAWKTWVDGRQLGNKPATRERFLNGVVAFQHFAQEHHGLKEPTKFVRDKKARNPQKRARRSVSQLRPDLIGAILDACHITLRAQLAMEWSTGARVSSILYGAKLCDLILAPGREQLIFRDTKNGKDVPAALHPATVGVMHDYLKWRGGLHDREQPLFLTYKRKPYADNGKAGGGQNKTGFKAGLRRARRTLLDRTFSRARQLRRAGQREQALSVLLEARADARLLRRVTQHWFRHMLATRMAHRDLKGTMEQGGWEDHRSVLGYVHDVPERRRSLVAEFEGFGTSLTRDDASQVDADEKLKRSQ